MKKYDKRRRRCEKMISGVRFGGTPVFPEELLEFAKSEEFVRFAKNLARPVSCEQGAAGLP